MSLCVIPTAGMCLRDHCRYVEVKIKLNVKNIIENKKVAFLGFLGRPRMVLWSSVKGLKFWLCANVTKGKPAYRVKIYIFSPLLIKSPPLLIVAL